jgi:ribA/ribD-fused uncharacterized protein
MNQDQEFVFFCAAGRGKPFRCFSNWLLANFEENGVKFTSTEQYIMYHKALLMGEKNVAANILCTEDPAKIKQHGRSIKNYDDELWSKRRYEVGLQGNRLKFAADSELAEKLLSTGNAIIAEAASYDPIWGIGMSEKDPNVRDQTKWGQNLLGKVLMQVREELRNAKAK